MDPISSQDGSLLMDLESGPMTNEEGTNESSIVLGKRQANTTFINFVPSGFMGSNVSAGPAGVEYCGNPHGKLGEPSEVAPENVQVLIGSNNSGGEEHMALVENKHMQDKHKKANYKKAPKPPRPPKGLSLDAGDMKLVKEISTIAMKKRARTERLKALRKMKEAKKNLLSSSSSSSSAPSSSLTLGGSLFALLITVFFFLVILFQGFRSQVGSSVSFKGSPEPALATKSFISVEFYNHPSANDGSGMGS